jgi:integrase
MTIRSTIRGGKPYLVLDIVYRKPDGTKGRYRRDAQVQTMTAARAEERRLLAELGTRGEIVPVRAPEPKAATSVESTFSDAVAIYRKATLPLRKPSTQRGYVEILDCILVQKLGKLPLSQCNKAGVSQLDVDLVTSGVSASRRRNVHVVLRAVLRTAIVHGLIEAMPSLPKLPKVGRVATLALSREDLTAVLSNVRPHARLACALAAYAGLRLGKVRGLRWPDVDLQAGIITVRRSVTGHKKGRKRVAIESAPKSGHQRVIPISPALRTLLASSKRTPWGPVAPARDGGPWGDGALLRAFQTGCRKAKLEGVRKFHSLRHYFVSELFRKGAGARAIQDLAGHLHLSTTQHYAAVGEKDRRDAVALLG